MSSNDKEECADKMLDMPGSTTVLLIVCDASARNNATIAAFPRVNRNLGCL